MHNASLLLYIYDNGNIHLGVGGISQDYVEALTLLKKSAGQGNVLAMLHIAAMYYNGLGVTLNEDEAFKWHERYEEAYNGNMMTQDSIKSFNLYENAAEQGEVKALFSIGRMYLMGEGVPQDLTESFNWFKKATEQGGGGAQSMLGQMYEEGEGVSQDSIEAKKWKDKARTYDF